MKFEIATVILRMEDISGPYPLLLGRPWLRQARVKQDWQSDQITIRKGKKKLKLSVRTKQGLRTPLRPMMVEGINMMDGIDRKSTRLNSSHSGESRMPSSA